MSNNYQYKPLNNFPYNIELTFIQICQYKCFEVNLKRALLMNKKENFKKVRLINSLWFDKWKKISCYEAIKDELDIGHSIKTNFQNNKINYLKIFKNLQIVENLESNINNNLIVSGFDDSLGKITINPYSNFELISQELWDSFVPPNTNNPNEGTLIELDVEYFTDLALAISLNKTASYIVFWNLNEEKLGKIILIFPEEVQKFKVYETIKNLGINSFYFCYLNDLINTKDINNNNLFFTCLNKSRNKLMTNNIINNVNNHNSFNNMNGIINNNTNFLLPVGLRNFGVTCFMNSTLQSFVHINKLSNYFLQKKNEIDENSQTLSFAYLKIVQNLLRKTNESQYITYYSPINFYGIICTNPLFNSAGDSFDLINYFLQTIHSELNFNINENTLSKYQVNDMYNNLKFQSLNNTIFNFISTNNSIITNIFYLIEKSKLKCCNCNQIQYNFQFLSNIIFPLEEIRKYKLNNLGIDQYSVTLIEGFDYYIKEYPLNGASQIQCNFCGMMSNAYQSNSFYSLPYVLIINLNRGNGNIFNIGIKYPEYIDLSKYSESNLDNNKKYKLISIITHFGPSGLGGHFIAFCFVKDKNSWFQFNDSQVTQSNFYEASNTGDTYLLFYERQYS